MRDVVDGGSHVARADPERSHTELISHQFAIDDPRRRLIHSARRPVNIFQCVGQFLWITQGNFNLDAISYYQPAAAKYSSDGVKMIGAYGPRLFGVGHLNQMEYILDILDEDPQKRKAVASIYLPHFDQHRRFDQHGRSDEVPCTLSLQYLVRDGGLLALTYMRSQDAFNVLPYDVFNFTMLQEYARNRLVPKRDLDLGPYYHYSGSFHVYDQDREAAESVLDEPDSDLAMPPMPYKDVGPGLKAMNEFESIVRTTVVAKTKGLPSLDFESLFRLADMLHDDYWMQFGYLLLFHGARKLRDEKHQDMARGHLRGPYDLIVDAWMNKSP